MEKELESNLNSDLESLIHDFSFLTSMIYDLSMKFEGMEAPKRVAMSTHFLAHVFDCCYSTLILLPYNEHSKIDNKNFDIFFHLSIFRNIIETLNNMYYFSLENISPIEEEFRILLFSIHKDSEAKKIATYLGFDQSLEAMDEEQASKRKEKMKNNTFFLSLPIGFQKELLKGKIFSHLTQYELSEKRGLEKNFFSGIYKFLSNYTHSAPLALDTIATSKIHDFSVNLYSSFLALILQNINWSISDMLLRMSDLWEFDIAREDSLRIVSRYINIYNEEEE